MAADGHHLCVAINILPDFLLHRGLLQSEGHLLVGVHHQFLEDGVDLLDVILEYFENFGVAPGEIGV